METTQNSSTNMISNKEQHDFNGYGNKSMDGFNIKIKHLLEKHTSVPFLIGGIFCFALVALLVFIPLFQIDIPVAGNTTGNIFGIFDTANVFLSNEEIVKSLPDSLFIFFQLFRSISYIDVIMAVAIGIFGFCNILSFVEILRKKKEQNTAIFVSTNSFAAIMAFVFMILLIIISLIGNSIITGFISSQGTIGEFLSGILGNPVQIAFGIIVILFVSIFMWLVFRNLKHFYRDNGLKTNN